MCGITGWIDWHQDLTKKESIIEKMAAVIGKQIPDAAGVRSADGIALGHSWLAAGPAGGAHPLEKTKDGHTFTIVYNGELYNTKGIRKQLEERGHLFHSHSDAEVLLHSYMEWGEYCVDYLTGIFAVAVWDSSREQLFLARDRLGVKPLFYKETNGSFLFGSEIKAIMTHPGIIRKEVDEERLQGVIGVESSSLPGNETFWGIKELRPAQALVYDRNGLKIWRYWNSGSSQQVYSSAEIAEHARLLLRAN